MPNSPQSPRQPENDKNEVTIAQSSRENRLNVHIVASNRPGDTIAGKYKLIENIGEGGMGSVWLAEQKEPVKRKVAIKLIKAGMDTKTLLARFEAERQALALMDHPHIAKVFDGGTTEQGYPYFVMEYVKGIPFTEYCDKAKVPVTDRLRLFMLVCQAVQHAHHKGVVHRDLKPSNILISLEAGKPNPKIIDFGLAKAMFQPLTDASIHTCHGMLLGTPTYMSPEQAELNNLDIDTRADVYSLGVILYELLTSTTPIDREQLRKAASDEILRMIRHTEPPRPSARLSEIRNLSSIAADRSLEPNTLQRTLIGDLDWIVMKAIEKERSRRYETAASFARDVERYLQDETVEACPPSQLYRLRKFFKKHRNQVLSLAVVFMGLLCAAAGLAWGWKQSHNANVKVRGMLSEVVKERDEKKWLLEQNQTALRAEAMQRDLAERRLCESILRSIGADEKTNSAELRALTEWAEFPDDRLKRRVLELGLVSSDSATRLVSRIDQVLQASVGLRSPQRASTLELLLAKQQEADADPGVRAAACWMAMELGDQELPGLAGMIHYYMSLDEKNRTNQSIVYHVLTSLRNHSGRLAPSKRRMIWNGLFDLLRSDPSKLSFVVTEIPGYPSCRSIALQMLDSLASDLSDQERLDVWDQLTRGLSEEYSELSIHEWSPVLNLVAGSLDPPRVARGTELVKQRIKAASLAYDSLDTATLLRLIISHTSSADRESLMTAVFTIRDQTMDQKRLIQIDKIIEAIAPKLEGNEFERAFRSIQHMAELQHAMEIDPVSFTQLAPKLTQAQAAEIAEELLSTLNETKESTNGEQNFRLLQSLSEKLTGDQRSQLIENPFLSSDRQAFRLNFAAPHVRRSTHSSPRWMTLSAKGYLMQH